jgi:hypothetical protein
MWHNYGFRGGTAQVSIVGFAGREIPESEVLNLPGHRRPHYRDRL